MIVTTTRVRNCDIINIHNELILFVIYDVPFMMDDKFSQILIEPVTSSHRLLNKLMIYHIS